MEPENSKKLSPPGAMKKRRVVMNDGRRYLIFYTFETGENTAVVADNLPESTARNATIEEEFDV